MSVFDYPVQCPSCTACRRTAEKIPLCPVSQEIHRCSYSSNRLSAIWKCCRWCRPPSNHRYSLLQFAMNILCLNRCSMVRPCSICEFSSPCNQKCTHFRRKFDARIPDEMILPYRCRFPRGYELQAKEKSVRCWNQWRPSKKNVMGWLSDTHPIWTRHIPMHWSDSFAVPICSDASLLLPTTIEKTKIIKSDK